MVQPGPIEVSPEPRSKAEVAALVAAAREWNIRNGFHPAESEEPPSWWKLHVSKPLADYLRARFGLEGKKKANVAGNVGLAYLRLSRPPGRQIAVTIGQTHGDNSIKLAEGARLAFNDQNWKQGAVAVIQLDATLNTPTSAVYQVRSGNIPLSWSITFALLVAMFLFFGLFHRFMLPRPVADRPGTANTVVAFLGEFFKTFGAFFRKDRIGVLLLFLLFYRFAEAQLVSLVKLFLLDGREVGGLGLTTGQVGFAYGTVGIIALTCGGLLGGMLASRTGLKAWLWPMVLIMHLPDAMFVYLAYAQPASFTVINLCIAIEQFGYGFGFTAYMLYMIYIARGQHETAHYAICTGFMALGMMLPGMFSGWLQEIIGYPHFFVWVMLATVPGFLVVFFVPLDAQFGKKGASPEPS
jgi:PAT family beta-lactamase induction signal transducer AmpG